MVARSVLTPLFRHLRNDRGVRTLRATNSNSTTFTTQEKFFTAFHANSTVKRIY